MMVPPYFSGQDFASGVSDHIWEHFETGQSRGGNCQMQLMMDRTLTTTVRKIDVHFVTVMAGTYFTHSICDEVSQFAHTSGILKARSYMLSYSHGYHAGDFINFKSCR